MKKYPIITAALLTLLLSPLKPSYAFISSSNPAPVEERKSDKGNGVTVGQFSGGVTYSIPIEVPPGTNNLTPNFQLEYQSSAKGRAGLFGSGWTVNFYFVVRDTHDTPDYLADDTYKLIWEGTSYDLIDRGSGNYSTKNETFLNITRQTLSPQNSKGDYWVIKTTNGTRYRLGYSADSEAACSNRDYILGWALDQITDTNGNNIYFTYVENPYPNDVGAIYPLKIEYNNEKSRVVEFANETSDKAHMTEGYFEGCRIKYARNLKSITTKANGNQVKKYTLNYNTIVSRDFVGSFVESGSDNTARPATTFQYYPQASQWNSTGQTWGNNLGASLGDHTTQLIDVNGDALPDIVWANSDTYIWKVWLSTGVGWNPWQQWANNIGASLANNSTRLADVNRDGLPDIVWANADNYLWKVWLNDGTKWGPTPQTWANNIGASFVDVPARLVDVNGDGLTDIVDANANTGPWNVWINNGSGWSSTSQQWANNLGTSFEGSTPAALVDVNGDGLPDIVDADTDGGPWKIWLNDGGKWVSTPQTWANNIGASFEGAAARFADVNGDGLADIVDANTNSGSWNVWLNDGTKWSATSQQWANNLGASFENTDPAQVIDVDGDGLPEIVDSNTDTGPWSVWLNPGRTPDLLSSISTSTGAKMDFEYTPSTRYPNYGGDSLVDLPFTMWIVSKVIINNGMTNSAQTNDTTAYYYTNGLYNWANKEFRGFGTVYEYPPNGSEKTYVFDQGDGAKGKMKSVLTKGTPGGNYMAKTENTWTISQANGAYTTTLTKEVKSLFDGVTAGPKVTEIGYQYDAFGNVTKKSEKGDTGTTGDERYTYYEYAINVNSWITNAIKHAYINAADDVTTVSESWNYYDDHLTFHDAPDKGNLTKNIVWSNSPNLANPTTLYEYDSYGNQTKMTDANGHATSTGYDPLSHTYPVSTTNAKTQASNRTYDVGTGNLLTKTDLNGNPTSYSYDVFGRITKEVQPYDSSSFPTMTYQYFTDGTAPEGVLISKRETTGASGALDTYTWKDGLERDIQTRSEAKNSALQIVTDTFYDPTNQIKKVSVPHYDASNSSYTSPVSSSSTTNTYDTLGRLTSVTNPKGDTRTIVFDHWKETTIDENGHIKRAYKTAYDKISKVEEINGTSTYTTTYLYDTLDNLTKIADNASNIFTFAYDSLRNKITQTDPDMGTWRYEYDGLSNQIKQTDNKNIVTLTTYDELDRIKKVDYPTDTDVNYTYDGNSKLGTLTSVTDGAGTTQFTYDNRLRKLTEKVFLSASN